MKLSVYIDSNSNENQFKWDQQNQTIIEMDNPFSLETSQYSNDKRIPPTINFLQEEQSKILDSKNMSVLDLWSRIESMI